MKAGKVGKEWRSVVSLGFRRRKSTVDITGFTGIRRLILDFDPICLYIYSQM